MVHLHTISQFNFNPTLFIPTYFTISKIYINRKLVLNVVLDSFSLHHFQQFSPPSSLIHFIYPLHLCSIINSLSYDVVDSMVLLHLLNSSNIEINVAHCKPKYINNKLMNGFGFMIIRFQPHYRPSALQHIYFPYSFSFCSYSPSLFFIAPLPAYIQNQLQVKIQRPAFHFILHHMFYVFNVICILFVLAATPHVLVWHILFAGFRLARQWLNNNTNEQFTQSDVEQKVHR